MVGSSGGRKEGNYTMVGSSGGRKNYTMVGSSGGRKVTIQWLVVQWEGR